MSVWLLLSSSIPYPPPPLLRRGILRGPTPLRASLPLHPRRLGLLAAARGDGGGRQLVETRRARAVGVSGGGGGHDGGGGGTGITAAATATVALAVMNRVLYKLALVPMKNYPFFLAQVLTFGWSNSSVVSGANGGPFLSDVKFFWPAVMMASSACQAGASIIKEFVFIDGAKRLEGKRPDIFVVNSFGSGFQALFVFLLLPFLSNLKGIPLVELPAYVNRGAACFLNSGGNLNDCHGAPLLPLLFITMNMALNISVLNLVKMSTALVASLTATLAVPLSIYVLSLPLPYMPGGTSLSTSFLVGAAVLVLGLLLYNLPQNSADHVKTD